MTVSDPRDPLTHSCDSPRREGAHGVEREVRIVGDDLGLGQREGQDGARTVRKEGSLEMRDLVLG